MSEGLRKRKRYYTEVPSATIEDDELSFKALGILTYLLNKPDGWIVRADAIARSRKKDGRDAIGTGLKELAERGHYRVERRRLRDGTFAMGNAVSEEPVPSWVADFKEYEGKPVPLVEQPDGTFKVKKKDGTLASDGFTPEFLPVAPVPENPEPGSPEPEDPGTGKAEPGEPGAVTTTEELELTSPLRGDVSRVRAARDAHANTPREEAVSSVSPESGAANASNATQRVESGGRGQRKPTRIPNDWAPSARLLDWAAKEVPGLDVVWETESFVKYWRDDLSEKSPKARKSDWDRTWQNQMRDRFIRLGLDRRVPVASPEPTLFDELVVDHRPEAEAITTVWLDHCAKQGPVLGTVRPRLLSLVLDALSAGADVELVKRALVACAEPCPPVWKLQKALQGQDPHGGSAGGMSRRERERQDSAEHFARAIARAAEREARGETSADDSARAIIAGALEGARRVSQGSTPGPDAAAKPSLVAILKGASA